MTGPAVTGPAPVRLVLVHGAWHGAWAWDRVAARLAERAVTAELVQLPGLDRAPGRHDLAGHVEHLRARLRAGPRPVVVCGHSYGGAVVTAAAAGLSAIRRLVYVAAFAPAEGESCADVNPATPTGSQPPLHTRHGDYLHVDAAVAAQRFYADCPADLAASAIARLTPEHVDTVRAPVPRAAWRDVPSTYVVCRADAVLPADTQRAMAGRVTTAVPGGHRVESDAAHSPMLSRPDELAELLAATVRSAAG